ncbi:MAG: nicotinamide-nucleotide amidohydrolase family protein [Desulfotignum sp.]|jgi:nicotinamide-nucleotide amidase|nr:nicotinamide-nucleotide amidohydrolase family protein [Desulfotignum sp.]
MIAEILSTGDEVMLGDLVDTNSAYLCDRLKQLGIVVSRITARGDDIAAVKETVLQISRRARICLVTGGLGPTSDDITAQACARAAGQPLKMHPQAYETMKTYFNRRGFALTTENKKQAMLPAAAGVMENTCGTAPGFFFKCNQCLFFCMPGVPSEMKQMMETQVVPHITKKFSLTHNLQIRRLTIFGLPESRVGVLLQEFKSLFPHIRLGFRASFPTIEVKLVFDTTGFCPENEKFFDSSSQGEKELDAEKNDPRAYFEKAGDWVVRQLGNKVVSLTGLSLEAEVGRLLKQQNQTLAVAESCTGGLISHLITEVPGSSEYFLLSAVTYANAAKIKVLGVAPETLASYGAVHENTALEMAQGARQVSGSDWAVSTTGIAGPGGGPTQKKVGTVCVGLAGPGVADAMQYHFTFDDRGRNKKIFAAMALEVLRRQLAEGHGGG